MGIRYNPALDGLRAVAVLAVVAYHAGLPVPAGYVGVDIFFVISGYLITRLLHDELQATGRIDFMGFYARRARRILPALALVVLATLALSLSLPDISSVARSAAAASAFVANIFFQRQTSDYWATASEQMPLLHLWSLSVEEQFYLAWPLVLLLVRRRPTWALAALALGSFALSEWWLAGDATQAFYQTPARAWELAVGGLVALRPMRLPAWSGAVGLVVTVAACFAPIPHFPGIGALPAVLGAALLVASLQSGQRVRVLEAKPAVYIGLISYSLYLWHWPLLALARASRVGETPISVRVGLCLLAVALAALTYRFIETPFRRLRVRAGRTVIAGIACAAAMSTSAFALTTPTPTAVTTIPRASSESCHPWGRGVKVQMQPARCVPDAPKVVLWGDSFTGPWADYALQVASVHGDAAVRMVTERCPPVPGIDLPSPSPRLMAYCRQQTDARLAFLQQHGADTLIVAGYWAKALRDNPAARDGMLHLVRALPNIRRIIVVGATPEIRDAVEQCQAVGQSCDIPRAQFDQESSQLRRVMAQMAESPNVEVVPIGDWLCNQSKCPGVRDGMPLYFKDNHHVSREAVAAYLHEKPLGM
jgi:peptidoglycan/LPS O-acetylase OafA/YrhL